MCETAVVGQDQLLALDIDVIDIAAVDDESPPDTEEHVVIPAQLLMNHVKNLSQLEGEHSSLVVNLHKVAVVAVRRDKDNLVWCDAHQIYSSGYDQIRLGHGAAKVKTILECKDRLLLKCMNYTEKCMNSQKRPADW